jgi:hypothetical protein
MQEDEQMEKPTIEQLREKSRQLQAQFEFPPNLDLRQCLDELAEFASAYGHALTWQNLFEFNEFMVDLKHVEKRAWNSFRNLSESMTPPSKPPLGVEVQVPIEVSAISDREKTHEDQSLRWLAVYSVFSALAHVYRSFRQNIEGFWRTQNSLDILVKYKRVLQCLRSAGEEGIWREDLLRELNNRDAMHRWVECGRMTGESLELDILGLAVLGLLNGRVPENQPLSLSRVGREVLASLERDSSSLPALQITEPSAAAARFGRPYSKDELATQSPKSEELAKRLENAFQRSQKTGRTR